MNQDRDKLKLSAILSADVVGYSRLMEEDQAWTIKNLEENKTLISNLVEEYKGRVVDAPGDNILTEFSSVTNAVECAVKIQEELKKKNANIVENRRMEFRIGVNLGEVVEEGGRIYGSGVNIAARIEGLSKSGGICISGRTYDHIKSKFDFGYEFLGEHNVKNISEPIRVYRVLMEPEAAGKVIGETGSSDKKSLRMSIFIILIVIVAGLSGWFIYSNQSKKLDRDSIEYEKVAVDPQVKEGPKTIAVLLFDNVSSDPEQDHFAYGLSEEILNSLCQIPGLGVTGKTSSFSFKGTNKTIPEIASNLGVDHILEGSVRKFGDELRITAQLIRASDSLHLWSETYDREFKDIFDIQEDIANSVADKLKLTLEAFQILGGTENVDAYEQYLNAKGHIYRNEASLALGLIDKAIELDPEFALAWALKSDIQVFIAVNSSPDLVEKEQDKALEAAQRAINIEPELAEANATLGQIRFIRDDLIGAESALQKALKFTNKPSSVGRIVGQYYDRVGYLKRANIQFETVRRNDPFNEINRGFYIFSFGILGDLQNAEEEYKRCIELFGESWGGYWAISLSQLMNNIVPENDLQSIFVYNVLKKNIESRGNALTELHQIYTDYDNLTNINLIEISLSAAHLGDPEFSMDALERAYNIDKTRNSIFWAPVMKEVRQLPRFKKFVREIGLVDYWEEYGWPDLCRPVGDNDFECD